MPPDKTQIINSDLFKIQNRWIVSEFIPITIPIIIFCIPFGLILFMMYTKASNPEALLPVIGFMLFILLFFIVIGFLPALIFRMFFKFRLEGNMLVFNEGWLWKKEKTMFYETLQHVEVSQGLMDRVFKVATLKIDVASANPFSSNIQSGFSYNSKKRKKRFGLFENRIIIPGLNLSDASAMKDFILQKMNEHPHADTQSGL